MGFWEDRRVLVTGGGGFLGSFIVQKLQKEGCRNLWNPRSQDFDLRERENIIRLYEESRPDIVIHLAAVVGGIGANRANPGKFFYDNAIMGVQMIEYARQSGVKKFVGLGTVCAYPKFTPVPFREEDLWMGYPEETNAPYGLAKKMLLVQLQSYRQEYGFNGIYLIPVNLYGPGDKSDPENSHVIPGLIRKFIEAKKNQHSMVDAWGTGKATREFLYVEDAAEGIIKAAESYESDAPVNLGSGEEIMIADLVHMIKDSVGFEGTVNWDASKPDGQPRRRLDTSRAWKEFGWKAKVPFREGLSRTVEWFLKKSGRGLNLTH